MMRPVPPASVAATTPRPRGAPVGRRVQVTLTENERALALAFWARAGVVERRGDGYVIVPAWQRIVALAFPDP